MLTFGLGTKGLNEPHVETASQFKIFWWVLTLVGHSHHPFESMSVRKSRRSSAQVTKYKVWKYLQENQILYGHMDNGDTLGRRRRTLGKTSVANSLVFLVCTRLCSWEPDSLLSGGCGVNEPSDSLSGRTSVQRPTRVDETLSLIQTQPSPVGLKPLSRSVCLRHPWQHSSQPWRGWCVRHRLSWLPSSSAPRILPQLRHKVTRFLSFDIDLHFCWVSWNEWI